MWSLTNVDLSALVADPTVFRLEKEELIRWKSIHEGRNRLQLWISSNQVACSSPEVDHVTLGA